MRTKLRPTIVEFLYILGYKQTETRRKLMDALINNKKTVSLDKLKKKTGLDYVTVYRNVRLLEQKQILHRSKSLKAFFVCWFYKQKGCHHVVICQNCGRVEEFRPQSHKHPISRRFKFPVQLHEMQALCKLCL